MCMKGLTVSDGKIFREIRHRCWKKVWSHPINRDIFWRMNLESVMRILYFVKRQKRLLSGSLCVLNHWLWHHLIWMELIRSRCRIVNENCWMHIIKRFTIQYHHIWKRTKRNGWNRQPEKSDKGRKNIDQQEPWRFFRRFGGGGEASAVLSQG